MDGLNRCSVARTCFERHLVNETKLGTGITEHRVWDDSTELTWSTKIAVLVTRIRPTTSRLTAFKNVRTHIYP